MTIAKKLVRYSRLSREKQIPGEVATLRESFLCLLALAVSIKPLANIVANYTCSD